MTTPSWISRNRVALRLGVRISVAGLLAFAICRLLGIAQSYPAVLTAVITTQSSAGASLRATLDRFIGTLAGAAWGVAIILLFPTSGTGAMALALMAALVPLAFVAAFKPTYRIAPITSALLLLTTASSVHPLVPALQRMLGVGLGGAAALVVSLLLFREQARESLAEASSRVLSRMGDLMDFVANATPSSDRKAAVDNLYSELRKALTSAETAADEVHREQLAFFTEGPNLQPICRTFRRLRTDLVMIGRATAEPLPSPLRERLSSSTAGAAREISAFLRASAVAVQSWKPAPSLSDVDRELEQHFHAISEARRLGLARDLSDEIVGRIFGLEFALKQMQENLRDLMDRINELA